MDDERLKQAAGGNYFDELLELSERARDQGLEPDRLGVPGLRGPSGRQICQGEKEAWSQEGPDHVKPRPTIRRSALPLPPVQHA
jgi:hypothetical protein